MPTLDSPIKTTNYLWLPARKQAELLRICRHSSNTDGAAIGFLTGGAYLEHARRGNLVCVTNNQEVVGYVLQSMHQTLPRAKSVITWVRKDARMLDHGKALLEAATRRALRHGKYVLEADVAEDIPANAFWQASGYEVVGYRPAGKVLTEHRLRDQIRLYRQIITPDQKGRSVDARG